VSGIRIGDKTVDSGLAIFLMVKVHDPSVGCVSTKLCAFHDIATHLSQWLRLPTPGNKKADVVEPPLGLRPRRLTRQWAPRGRVAPYLVIRLILWRPGLTPAPHLLQSIAFRP
jgi:hypothetical protein